MSNTDDELTNDRTEEQEEDDYQLIDPNDLTIIDDPDNWKPDEEKILAYATLLGYDPSKDPKEILKIAEKYLTIKLEDHIRRAFMRVDNRILYIDMNTQEIKLESDLETRATEEIEECRKKAAEKLNPPFKNNLNNTEEELKKKLEEQKQYNDSLRNSVQNIEIIDAPSDDENKEDKIEDKKEENNNKNKKEESEEESSSEENKKEDNINYKNNIDNKPNKKEELIENKDDNFESSRSSNEDQDMKKTIKSQNFDDFEEDKKETEIKNNKKNDDIINFRDKPLKKERSDISKGKYSNNNNIDDNSSDEDKNEDKKSPIKNKKDESKEKNNYLNKSIMSLKKYKNKLRQEYLSKKENFIKENSDKISENLRKKKELEMSQVNLEDLDDYEQILKQKMEQELTKYKKNLISKYEYEELNPFSDIDLKQKYDLKKLKLESDIRIQKDKNKSKEEQEIKNNKMKLEKRRKQLDEINSNKKAKLITKNKNDINSLEKEFINKYETYISQYKANVERNNDDINNDLSDDILKTNLKELEQEFIKELKENFEQEKIMVKYQLESDMIKELENIKIQNKIKQEQEIQKINEKMNNLGNEYFSKKNEIKNNLNIKKEKDELFIKQQLQRISGTFFNEIKNKYLNKLNEEMNQINSIIKQNNNYSNNYDKPSNENIEINIQEKILDKFIKRRSKLYELKSIYDITEQEYNKKKLGIEFISKVIYEINKILLEKGSNFSLDFNLDNNNKDDLLVEEIKLNLENKSEEFKIKNRDKMNNKIYPFLNDEIQNLMENIRNDKEKDINLNNNYFFSKSNQINNNNNLFSYNNNEFRFQSFLNNNSLKFKNNNKKSFSLDKRNNNYITNNSLIENGAIKMNNNNNNNLNNININFNSQENIDPNNLELSPEILNLFTKDILYIYHKIISFIKEEPSLIEKEKQDLNKKEGFNNTLKSLKDNDNFINYKNDFNFILSQEQRTSRNIKSNIESKVRLFNKIKSSWEETMYYIYNNYSKPDSIKMKLNIILELIDDYKYLSKSNKRERFGDKIYNNYNVFNSSRMNNNFRYGENILRTSSYDRKYN